MREGDRGDEDHDPEEMERARVQSYVPKYQRDEWDEHAEELDMNRSEFIRCMVQAGRKTIESDAFEPDSRDAELREKVREAIEAHEPVTYDTLLAALERDFEAELGTVLDELQDRDAIRWSNLQNAYLATER